MSFILRRGRSLQSNQQEEKEESALLFRFSVTGDERLDSAVEPPRPAHFSSGPALWSPLKLDEIIEN